mmetsp:Transcript_13218/g.25274  ORF Transcript_13218/g.25274 Transcript_13218/m.25274 type:complete len:292 (+) Transcript_13218:460-1335(+)
MASSASHLEDVILELCRNNPDGLQDGDLEKELLGVSVADRAIAINSLLGKRRVELFRLGDKLVYKEVKAEDMAKLKGCTQEDLLVYQLIKNADTVGIWTKDLRMKSNLMQTTMAKVLKTLEMRKLIKAVKSVSSKNRKVYMLYELEPSKELTGGAWYTEQEFDAEFISVLREHCLKFILHRGRVTLEDICDFVSNTGMSKVELRPDDVLQVVNTLVFDGMIDAVEEPSIDNDEEVFYLAATLKIPEQSAFTSIPCGVCPVFHECREDGLISPATCVYFNSWLAPAASSLEW